MGSRFTATLVCLALAATPAAAQVKPDGTPVETAPAPTTRTDHTARDAAVAAGVIAVGTALWLRHKQKAAEAAAAAAPPPAPETREPTAVETPTLAAVAAPAPAVVETKEPTSVETPNLSAPPPTPAQTKDAPVQLSHHGSSTSANQRTVPVVPAVAPVVQPAVQPAPAVAPAPPRPDDNRNLWLALGVLGVLLLAAGALPRMLLAPPTFRARVKMKPPAVAAPAFRVAEEAAA